MILVDANILLYATDAQSPRHESARRWLEDALNGREEIGFPLVSLLAFVRLSTDVRVFAVPLEPREAVGTVEATGRASRRWLRERARKDRTSPTHTLRRLLANTALRSAPRTEGSRGMEPA